MTATPSQPQETGPTGAQTLDPVRLVWDVLTSPVTFMLAAATQGLLIALGTYIGQGMTEGDLLAERSFAVTRTLRGLGLTDLPTSWVVWSVGLVLLLNGLGLVLRYVWLTPPHERGWGGPAIDHATGTMTAPLEAVAAALDERMGRTARVAGAVVARSGYWVEGLVIVAIGLMALLGALVVDHSAGMEARLEMLAGGAEPVTDEVTNLVVRVREEGAWIERQLPFKARCTETALADPQRGWACDLTRTLPGAPGAPPLVEEATLSLGPGWPAEAFGLTFHIDREHPVPGQADLVRLVDGAQTPARLVYAGPPRRTATLAGGHKVTPFAGPDGPLVVVTPTDGAPYLLTPSTDIAASPTLVGDVALASVSSWWLTLGATRRPGGMLLWTGLGLLLLGFAVLILAPHVTVTAREVDGELSLAAWSFNRLGVAQSALDALKGAV
ncbi:MAG: hypothetical protein QF464_01030 [Myxococcota bacterium]|jgi:hypothetical protein|nr:hypothetical protein [Myxococcota bacterium]